jgi:hypothetical protein
MELKRTCPECNLIFDATLPESGTLTCPLCDAVFSPRPPAALTPAPPAASASSTPPRITSGQHVLKGCVAVGTLLVLVGGLVYAYHLVGGIEQKTAALLPTPAPATPSTEAPTVIEVVQLPPPPQRQPPPREPALPQRPSAPPPIVQAPRRPLSLAERVNEAIDRGTDYLRHRHSEHNNYRNYLGLLGLTLLECGVPAQDPSVRQIAGWIRSRERDLWSTYELTLAILFLDRLNDPRDRTLLRTFDQRLLTGQLECGAWTYSCLNSDKRRPAAPPPLNPQIPSVISWSNAKPLSDPKARSRISYGGDNSNTQFAILGLWVAQRHGVSSRAALLAAEQYFRQTQKSDGSWAYHPNAMNYRDSMTCAGLMSLAMRYGVIGGQGRDIRPEHPVHVRDRAVTEGLRFLGRSLDKIARAGEQITGVEARDPLYFLWSLERMAVIYDLRTIGDTEWYPWAAEMLVEIQQPDGIWRAPYAAPIGTCFALLILKRSNPAHDLQLAVGEPPRRGPDVTGPTVIQGPDAALGPTTTRRGSPGMRGIAGQPGDAGTLGPSITRQKEYSPEAKKLPPPSSVPEKK